MVLEKLRRVVTFAASRATGRLSPVTRHPKPVMRETLAALGSSVSVFGAYNPDDLVTRKGYAIYDQMQTDAQVSACLNIKKFAVLSQGWEVHPCSDSAADREAAEFVRFCFQDMRGSILDALYKVLDAVGKGFSVCEISYKVIEDGPHRGRIGLAAIKAKDPSIVGFDVDDYLNVTGLRDLRKMAGDDSLPAEKFVVYTYMPRYESPYGQSDLRAAYKHWWSKDAIMRFYNTYLEKYGSPTVKGAYRRGTSRQHQDDLLQALAKIQQETAIVLPEDVQVEMLECRRGGDAGYLSALEWHDHQISKAILGQTLATDEGSRSGSYAQAKVHLEMMQYHLEKLKRDLEESVVGEQIIRRLVDYNFPKGVGDRVSGVGGYPRFRLGSVNSEQ